MKGKNMSVYDRARRYAIFVLVLFCLGVLWMLVARASSGQSLLDAVLIGWLCLALPTLIFFRCPRCGTQAFRWFGRRFWLSIWSPWPRTSCCNRKLDLTATNIK